MYDNQKVATYIMCTRKYFPENKIGAIKAGLNKLDDTTFYTIISSVKLKDPSMMLLISIFLGGLGVDRFMLGDTWIGILKLLTAGLCGILTITDWLSIWERTQEVNFKALASMLQIV